MKSRNLAKYSLIAGSLGVLCCTTCGAFTFGHKSSTQVANNSIATNTTGTSTSNTATATTPATTAAPVNQTETLSPQLQAAAQRVEKAKVDLDTAHKRLNASKAVLKAAESELRAAQADQQALSLKTEAQKLADASGMNDTGRAQSPTLFPAPSPQPGQAVPVPISNGQTFDNSGTVDFSAASANGGPSQSPGAPVAGTTSP